MTHRMPTFPTPTSPSAARPARSPSRRCHAVLTAALSAAALATVVLAPRSATVADAPLDIPTIRGKEAYSVRRAFSAKRPVLMKVQLSESGEFRVLTDRDNWSGQVVGTGAQGSTLMTSQQLEAIELSIANDLSTRFRSALVPKSAVKELKALQRETAEREAARDALVDLVEDLTTRINDLLNGGGIVPVDLLQSLQTQKSKAQADHLVAVAAVSEMSPLLEAAERRIAPKFDVSIDEMTLTFRQNAGHTRMRMKARIDFTAVNQNDFSEHTGRLGLIGRGAYLFTRG